MLRIMGAACIILGSTGIGFWYRQRLYTAVWHLRSMKQILEFFMGEIRYGKATLPECCKKAGERVEEPYRSALLAIYEKTEAYDGSSFAEKWVSCMTNALSDVPITQKEKEIFLGFSAGSRISDNHSQLQAAAGYRDMLERSIKSREEELPGQGRMAAGLGIMGGLLLTVILI